MGGPGMSNYKRKRIEIDGELLVVRYVGTWTDEDTERFAEIVRAARGRLELDEDYG